MKTFATIFFTIISLSVFSQTGEEAFLQQVEQNNQELVSARKLLEAEQTGSQTGLTPDNPTIEYGHFPGSNDAIGTKTTFGISQSFDFPTVYQVKKKLAENRSGLSEHEFRLFRQDKLLEAKLKFYDLLFLLKKEAEFKNRLAHSDKLYQSYQSQFEKGNTSVLDLNKARIQNLKIKSRHQILLQEIESTRKELELLAGGPVPTGRAIPLPTDELPALSTVLDEMKQTLPEWQYLEQAQKVDEMEIKLAKQNWMPEFEIAYEGETVPDGTYRGLKAGLSIPLWKDKKAVQYAKANAIYKTSHYDARKTFLLNETEKLYNQTTALAEIKETYRSTLDEAANVTFLDKALSAGQMSVIEYFNELAFYYESMDAYLEIEQAYIQSLAKLRAYKL